MDPLAIVLLLVALVLVVLVIVAPLRAGRADADVRPEAGQLADLETAKEAKYREIRDAELDYRTGKLSREDHRALDRSLRREAIAILEEIDRATAYEAGPEATR